MLDRNRLLFICILGKYEFLSVIINGCSDAHVFCIRKIYLGTFAI